MKDFLNKEISIGDKVVVSTSAGLVRGTVLKFNKKLVKYRNDSSMKEANTRPKSMVVV